jgi:hypothetical protein
VYTLKIWEPYEQDEIFYLDSLEQVKEFLTRHKFTTRSRIYHTELYLTPTPINVYELMGVPE